MPAVICCGFFPPRPFQTAFLAGAEIIHGPLLPPAVRTTAQQPRSPSLDEVIVHSLTVRLLHDVKNGKIVI